MSHFSDCFGFKDGGFTVVGRKINPRNQVLLPFHSEYLENTKYNKNLNHR